VLDPAHPFKPSLILHGGAWNSPDGPVEETRAGCLHALEAGWAVLLRGGTAMDAVEATIVAMENDPIFNAGTGANLNWDGRVELDAFVMDGRTLKASAVAAVGRRVHPSRSREAPAAGNKGPINGRRARSSVQAPKPVRMSVHRPPRPGHRDPDPWCGCPAGVALGARRFSGARYELVWVP
jgi:hypothetical protein